MHYTLYILLVIFAKPENVRSLGVHETVGDCNAVSSQYSTIGQVGISAKIWNSKQSKLISHVVSEITRMHSSRMRTARLCIVAGGGRCCDPFDPGQEGR